MNQIMKIRLPGAALRLVAFLCVLAAGPALAQQNPNDLVNDRPSAIGTAWAYAMTSLSWVGGAPARRSAR